MNPKTLGVAIFLICLVSIRGHPLAKRAPVDSDSSYDDDEEYVIEVEELDDDRSEPLRQITGIKLAKSLDSRSSPQILDLNPVSSNELDSEEEYSSVWGASSVEGSFIRKVLEEEDGIGVSFEELTRFQQEFGRRLGKSARPKLIDTTSFGKQDSSQQNLNHINRKTTNSQRRLTSTTARSIPPTQSSTTASTSFSSTTPTTTTPTTTTPTTTTSTTTTSTTTTPTTTTTTTTTSTTTTPTTTTPTTTTPTTTTPTTATPRTTTSTAIVFSSEDIEPESRDLSKSFETSTETSEEEYDETTETFAEIKKIATSNDHKQPKEQSTVELQSHSKLSVGSSGDFISLKVETESSTAAKLHGESTEAPASVSILPAIQEFTKLVHPSEESVSNIASAVVEDATTIPDTVSTESILDAPSTTLKLNLLVEAAASTTKEPIEASSTTISSSPAPLTTSSALVAESRNENDDTATSTEGFTVVRRIPGRKTGTKRFRLASSTAKSNIDVAEKPVSVTIRRRPVNRKTETASEPKQIITNVRSEETQAVVKSAGSSGAIAQSTQKSGNSAVTLQTPAVRSPASATVVTSTQKVESVTAAANIPTGIFGQRIRKRKQ